MMTFPKPPIWKRAHPVPCTLEQVRDEIYVDWNNIRVIGGATLRTIGYTILVVGGIGAVLWWGILWVTIFNPLFWVALATIKVLLT